MRFRSRVRNPPRYILQVRRTIVLRKMRHCHNREVRMLLHNLPHLHSPFHRTQEDFYLHEDSDPVRSLGDILLPIPSRCWSWVYQGLQYLQIHTQCCNRRRVCTSFGLRIDYRTGRSQQPHLERKAKFVFEDVVLNDYRVASKSSLSLLNKFLYKP
jgi:hypothetical protein